MFTPATKTMKLINEAIERDQGASFRVNLGKVLPHMKDAFRGDEGSPFRTHLGASVIGGNCGRAIWYGFRWATRPYFQARLLRLFNRGHLEEARFIAMLLTIGCQVFQQDEHGNQFRISELGGHFGGSGDGVAIGIPDIPESHAALLEFKTHNDKSFKKLKTDGVRIAKPEHYVQMQTYMRKMGLAYGLYMAVNKNDDDIHAEIIVLDTSIGDQYSDRARRIILMKEAPDRISDSPGWFECGYCDHKNVCHNGAAPERNCRTCRYSEAREDGNWYCNKPGQWEDPVLHKGIQLTGCEEYIAIK